MYVVVQYSSRTHPGKSGTYLIAEYHMFAFKVLPLGSYAPMPEPSPPLKTILELVLCTGLQSCRCIIPYVSMSSKCLPFNISFIFGDRKKVIAG